MLSSLPSLKHLALRHCTNIEGNFPHLPQLIEAHFYHCELPQKNIFERMPSLKVLAIDNTYCTEDKDTEVCNVRPLADTVETCAWLVKESAYYYYPLRQFRRVKHLKVELIRDLFGAVKHEIIPSCDGFPNLAATVETIEFTVGIDANALYHINGQESVEELRDALNMMEECCRKEWRKVRLIDISILALSYHCEPLDWHRKPEWCSIMIACSRLIGCVKKRFQRELGIELLIS